MTPFLVLWCILADDVLGWEIVLKISSFPPRLRLSAECVAIDNVINQFIDQVNKHHTRIIMA